MTTPAAANASFAATTGDCSASDWDACVTAAPDATQAHLSGWLDVMTSALGHEPVRLVARDRDGAIVGVLPLVWVRSALFGRYLVSMPFLDSGGPITIAGAEAARSALAQLALRLAQRGRAHLLELRTRTAGGAAGLRAVERKLTVALPLPATHDALWAALPSKVRSQVRRPQNAGYVTRFGADECDAFYDVYARHLRDLGSPAQGQRLFDAISRLLPAHVEFAAVYDAAGRPAAGGCGFAFRGTYTLVWAAALRRASVEAPNMLLYWSLMERAIARGLTTFDFGRCSPGSGTHRFKRQWGGADIPLPWQQWSPDQRTAPPQPTELRFRLAAAAWRRLPVPITRAFGPGLARLLP